MLLFPSFFGQIHIYHSTMKFEMHFLILSIIIELSCSNHYKAFILDYFSSKRVPSIVGFACYPTEGKQTVDIDFFYFYSRIIFSSNSIEQLSLMRDFSSISITMTSLNLLNLTKSVASLKTVHKKIGVLLNYSCFDQNTLKKFFAMVSA